MESHGRLQIMTVAHQRTHGAPKTPPADDGRAALAPLRPSASDVPAEQMEMRDAKK